MSDILSQEEIDLLLKSTKTEEEEISEDLVSVNDLIIEELKNNLTLLSYESDKIDNSNLVDFEGINYIIGFPPYKHSKSAVMIENFVSQSITKMISDNIELHDELETKMVISPLFSYVLTEVKKKYNIDFLSDVNMDNILSTSTNSVFSSLINLSDIGRFIKATYSFKIYDFQSEIIHIFPDFEDEIDTEYEINQNNQEYEQQSTQESENNQETERLSLEDILGDDDELYNSYRDINNQSDSQEDIFSESFDDEENNMSLLKDVPLEISVELGRIRKNIGDVLSLSPGEVLELDKLSGEPLDILINGKVVAKGEVVVIEENFGIKILEMKDSF